MFIFRPENSDCLAKKWSVIIELTLYLVSAYVVLAEKLNCFLYCICCRLVHVFLGWLNERLFRKLPRNLLFLFRLRKRGLTDMELSLLQIQWVLGRLQILGHAPSSWKLAELSCSEQIFIRQKWMFYRIDALVFPLVGSLLSLWLLRLGLTGIWGVADIFAFLFGNRFAGLVATGYQVLNDKNLLVSLVS